MHLLIVEDEQRLARLLQRVLTEERHIVDTAFDGTTGLAMAESTEYDLVVLDLMLPGMSGQAICRTLRTEGIHTPILMLTARGSVEDRVAGLKSGADDYLVKPFAMDEFLARVEAILRRGKLQTEPMEMVIGDLTLKRGLQYQLRQLAEQATFARQSETLLAGPTDELFHEPTIDNVVLLHRRHVFVLHPINIWISHLRNSISGFTPNNSQSLR